MNALPRITGLIAAQARAQRARLRLAAAGGAVVSISAVCLLGLSGWFITGAAFAGAAGAAAAQSFNYMMPSAIIRLLAILRTGGRYVERVAGQRQERDQAKARGQHLPRLQRAWPPRQCAPGAGNRTHGSVQDATRRARGTAHAPGRARYAISLRCCAESQTGNHDHAPSRSA